MRRKPIPRCPCCGQAVPDPIGFTPKVHFGAMQERLLRLVQRAPDGISAQELRLALYANDPEGGSSNNIIAVMARQMNRKLAPLGLRIKGTGGPGSVYRLLRTELQ